MAGTKPGHDENSRRGGNPLFLLGFAFARPGFRLASSPAGTSSAVVSAIRATALATQSPLSMAPPRLS